VADRGQSWCLDRVEQLLDRGRVAGYVTIGEIQSALCEIEQRGELYARQADDLFRRLQEVGAAVYETKAQVPAADVRALLETPGDGDGVPDSSLSEVPTGDFVGLYFAEIGDRPLLTHPEEIQLAQRMEQGSEATELLSRDGHDAHEAEQLHQAARLGREARDYLIWSNARLVVSIAKKYRGLGVPFLDLIQAGNIGLIRAADKYDYRRGTRFSTLATWWVRQAVARCVARDGRTIRLPVQMVAQIRQIGRAQQMLAQSLGRDPTPEEVAESLGTLSPDRVRSILRVAPRSLSLEMPIGEDGDDELGILIEDTTSPSPTDVAQADLLHDELAKALEGLPSREVRVLRLRYGLDGGRPLKLSEIGDLMGVTRERARQIVVKALRRLRHPRRSRQLQRYLE
jgi:RNA polymerase primary sigma factor